LRRYRDFCNFQDGGRRHLGFSKKIRNFYRRSSLGANMRHRAKFHQNRSHGCRDMAILRFSKWRPSAILFLWNSNFVTVGAVKRPILHQRTKFRIDSSNHCGDIAIFVIFQDGFSKIQNFYGESAARGQCASPCQISSKSAEGRRDRAI